MTRLPLSAGAPPSAQLPADPTDEALDKQERDLRLSRCTNDDAIGIGLLLVELGRTQSLPITVDVRRGTQQLFHAALEGTSADNDAWIERKIRAVYRFGISSYRLGCRLRVAGKTLRETYLVDENDFAPHGGAFPLCVPNAGVIGVVTVSGLPQREDHELVVQALTLWISKQQ
jgi:uncharacterized protein (UPF0303 family)